MQPVDPANNQEPLPDCQTCGTCCFSTLPEYVRVWGTDYDRLGDLAERYTHWIGNQCYMQMHEGHCSALEYNADTQRFSCSVYHQRPSICRTLEEGSSACKAERFEKQHRVREFIITKEQLIRR